MRRFLIWSALLAVIGLTLAVGGYWAYQQFYARFQPVTITRNQVEIQKLLEAASWVSAGGGGNPLYIIGYRDSATMQRYEREEAPKLRAAGVEVRFILFARPDREGLAQSTAAERATVAELWLTRDWALYQRWTATPTNNWTADGIAASDGNLARGAVVDAGREFIAKLADNLKTEGLSIQYPVVIWRDREGFMKACACSDTRSWVFIRDDLDAPDRLEPTTPMTGEAGETQAPPADGNANALPYPELAVPQTSPQADPLPSTGAQPARRSQPGTAPGPRQAPVPKQQDDSTFF